MAIAWLSLATVVAVVALGASDAAAQAFNVVTFQCTSGGDISVDCRGLGNTNVCVEGTFNIDVDCACVNNGGNCPVDAKKQSIEATVTSGFSVEPKNGRVFETIDKDDVGGAGTAGICDPLQSQCGTGQTARSITETVDATYTLCTTDAPAGEPCSCAGQETLATALDGACDTSAVTFAGKKNSCLALFP